MNFSVGEFYFIFDGGLDILSFKIKINFDKFTAPFTPECFFRLIRYIYIWNTREKISSAIQKPRTQSRILCSESHFQLSSRCFVFPIKHCQCFKYYVFSSNAWGSTKMAAFWKRNFQLYTVFHLGKRARKYLLVQYVIVS